MSSTEEKIPVENGNTKLSNGNGDAGSGSIKKKVIEDPLPPTDDPELDALLDDALKDFDNPDLLKPKMKPGSQTNKKTQSAELIMDSVWAEEFVKQATTQFEQKMREYLKSSLKDSSLEERKLLEDNMSKIVDAASTAALATTTDPEALSSQLNEAIRNAATKATGRKPPSSSGAVPDFNMMGGLPDDAEFARMMGGLGMGMGGLDDDGLDDSSMNEILPFMNNMMQKLLSKELLQPVLTDIVTKYPEWLANNREKLASKDFEKYSQQYHYMKQICEEYASEKESDREEVKKKRFERISDLMLKVQYAGPPPQELIGEDGTNPLPGFGDPSAGEQCSVM